MENEINEEMTIDALDEEILADFDKFLEEKMQRRNARAAAFMILTFGATSIGLAKAKKWIRKRKEAKDEHLNEEKKLKNVIYVQSDTGIQEIVPTEETDEETKI